MASLHHVTMMLLVLLLLSTLSYVASQTQYPPRFGPVQPITQREDRRIGSLLTTLTATDRNNDNISVDAYDEGTEEMVNLTVNKAERGRTEVAVILAKHLDRDYGPDIITLNFVASDRHLQTVLPVQVYIEDVNDTPPKFEKPFYMTTVFENSTVNSHLNLTIKATDPDNGLSGTVRYYLKTTGQSAKKYEGIFDIDETRGIITQRQKLNYENLTFYQYIIMAKDRGKPSLNGTADLTIKIADVQDTPPYFQGLPYKETIKEDESQFKLKIEAYDGDRGVAEPREVEYKFRKTGSSCIDYFNLDRSTGEITANKVLDADSGEILENQGFCTLYVQATEKTGEGPTNQTISTTAVTITVEDVNDNEPKFNESKYEAVVAENTTDVAINIRGSTGIYVYDSDQANYNSFDLKIAYSNGTLVQNVNPTPSSVRGYATIQIRLQNDFKFDYEVEQNMVFYVIATESSNSSRVTSCTVNLTITNRNDNFPVFSKNSYTASIDENPPNGTFVTQINATDEDLGDFGIKSYSLRGPSGVLRINKANGEIFTTCKPGDLDREKRDTYYFTVEAKDGGNVSTSVQLIVKLLDENDNPPVFQSSSYDVSTEENSLKFSMDPFKLSATDLDMKDTPNSHVMYDINAGYLSQNFSVNATTGIISLVRPLDYEQLESNDGVIIIVANASDRGSPMKTANTTNITIQVQDMNDNAPTFEKSDYIGHISEGASQGSHVTTVTATDTDGTKRNNEVTYSILSGSFDRFRIDRKTGSITVDFGAKLDRETRDSYHLQVIAIDRGSPALNGTTDVTINITDVNDEPPIFKQSNFETNCFENISTHSQVYNCTASDPDENPSLSFSITEVSGVNSSGQTVNKSIVWKYFEIDKSNGTIYVKSPLDRETTSRVTLTLQVNDTNGEDEQIATSTITITILDNNDEPPKFISEVYNATISESSARGTNLITVSATDVDINTHIKYTITDQAFTRTSNSAFKIGPYSGAISTTKPIDREVDPMINVTVSAFDGVDNATCLVIVKIQDVNDNFPQFLPYANNISIVEGNYTEHNLQIAVIKATDKDDVESGNGNVTYQLQNTFSGIFEINETTAAISIVSVLDREYQIPPIPYVLTIIASDNPKIKSESRKNSTKLTVTILDINDNFPILKCKQCETKVFENEKKDAVLDIPLTATDPDNGLNGTDGIQYSFDLNSNKLGLFSIDHYSGKITIAKSLTDKAGSYELNVQATDGGNCSTMQNITIIVKDINNHAPVFTNANSTYSIYECAKPGTELTTIHATDADKGVNKKIIYSFDNETVQDLPFELNEDTGVITVADGRRLDHEVTPKYTVRIVAKDKGEPAPLFTQSGPITIQILDVNDSPPKFAQKRINIATNENEVNKTITTVKATDDDSTPEISYDIEDSQFSGHFTIGEKSGEVILIKELDRETTPVVNITITATDSTMTGNLPNQCNQTSKHFNNTQQMLIIRVIDEDDNPPVFIQRTFNAGVRQQREGGKIQEILSFQDKVRDRDLPQNSVHTFGINGIITYSQNGLEARIERLSPDSCPKDHEPKGSSALCLSSNGTLSTNMLFDTGIEGYMIFPVIVSDNGGNDTADIKVFLIADSQVAQMTFLKTKEDVRKLSSELMSAFSNLTHRQFVSDGIQEDIGNTENNPRTKLLFHVVEPGNNKILSAQEVVSIIDALQFQSRYALKSRYGVNSIEKLQTGVKDDDDVKSKQLYTLIAIVALEALVLLVVISFSCKSSSKYRRKLKAATVTTKGSMDDKTTKDAIVPGSNLYAATKNPLLNKEIKTPKLDEVSINSTNSLDVNEVGAKGLRPSHDALEEKEAVVEMYGDDYYKPDLEVDALQMVLQDYERIKDDEDVKEQSENVDMGTINPIFDMETTEV